MVATALLADPAAALAVEQGVLAEVAAHRAAVVDILQVGVVGMAVDMVVGTAVDMVA